MKKQPNTPPVQKRSRERGSALLMTLMVMVGLSLLGLAFVGISETENSISVNQRNYTQTQYIAEAGARVALEWFQDPVWATTQNLMPANTNAIKNLRITTYGGSPYSGYYKPTGYLFDRPFKGYADNRFYGTETKPDIVINGTTAATFLADFNAKLFTDLENGEVVDIRMYAPPIISGTVNADGFWDGGVRYGVCTIKVTARRYSTSTPRQVQAERWVKLVVSEWPFPGPQGPVQSNANISTGGAFGVHWGRMTSEGDMEIKRALVGLPWYDAWDSVHFDDGYFWNQSAANANGDAIPIAANGFYDEYPFMRLMYDKQIEDPWFEARARGRIINATNAGITIPHPYKYDQITDNIVNEPNVGYSNWFQNQDRDEGPPGDYKRVNFPSIDYEFWKNISQAASTSNSSVHYLRWVAGENYTDGVDTKNWAKWVNTVTGAKPGFYFFDSKNGLNPQGPGAPGILAPPITLNASDDGNDFIMKGFMYFNVESWGSQGINGPGGWFNFPSEPYRDSGHKRVDEATMTYYDPPQSHHGAGNGVWDKQDLNGNGRIDIFLAQETFTPPGGGAAIQRWMPVEWFPGCRPGWNGESVPGGAANCSEPHEPFLNLIYPAAACCSGGGAPNKLQIGWENPSSFTQRPTKKNSAGTPVPCNAALLPPDPDCTHNGRNETGPLVENFGNSPNTKPIMDGVMYNEGGFDTQGNASYFGSILINGNIDGTGTPEVWFDECLIKGCWQDKFTEMPRVYVTAHETDQ